MIQKLTILGCGGSAGVPAIGNDWGVCDPHNPKNRRTRCAALVQSDTTSIVIDTGSDFCEQMTRIGLKRPDAIFYTHFHGDHINGFEELRIMYNRDKARGLIPLYADPYTQAKIRDKFPHMFATDDTSGFYPLPMEFRGWDEGAFASKHRIGDIDVSLVQMHHAEIMAVGYRFGDVAYCTDVHAFPDDGYAALDGVKTLIIDANNFKKQFATKIHMDLNDVIAANARIKAGRVILTHLKNDVDYDRDSKDLPSGFELAYDGLTVNIG